MGYSECLPTRLNPLAEGTCFSQVGDVSRALNASGRYANSITIFSSDNGAPGNPIGACHKQGSSPGYIARNYPYRGRNSPGR